MRHIIDHILRLLTHRRLWGCVSISFYLMVLMSSCGDGSGDTVKSDLDSLDFATLTTGVSTLISDSGITRYKLKAQEWYTYNTPVSKWYFPKGFYLEQFDTLFNIEASVQADTAYYYQDQKLWKLKGHVEILNRDGDRFYGYSIFWNQADHTVYSDDSITIIKSDGQTINAKYGFTGNEQMSQWTLRSSNGVINVSDEPMPGDSIREQPMTADSLPPTTGGPSSNSVAPPR